MPCGPVNDMLQALADPQTLAREMVVEVEHSTLGRVKTIGLPVKFSETPGKVRKGAPLYGEHTRAILREYGFRRRRDRRLREGRRDRRPRQSAGEGMKSADQLTAQRH